MQSGYPRPQMVRNNWMDLCGRWSFCFDDLDQGEQEAWYGAVLNGSRDIVVPFSYETALSGIGEELFHPVVWYQREFTYEANGKRTLIHFEGADYETKVWINGQFAGMHCGAYERFSFDITKFLKPGDNQITVRVKDSNSCEQPRGKQRWKQDNFGCWYVQTTGIWKEVWLEQVATDYIEMIKITPDIDKARVAIRVKINSHSGNAHKLSCYVYFREKLVASSCVDMQEDDVELVIPVAKENDPWQMQLWSPQNPNLYDAIICLENDAENDEVATYFGMRKISIENGQVLLNNLPLYQRLILDQGYWEESGLSAPSEEALIRDIDLTIAAGYNGLRKHEKIESEKFLYWCDKKGLLVWCEMPSTYSFSDTAMENFAREWQEIVRQNYNHPSVITWTAFNESWGIEHVYTNERQQKFTEGIYHLTKAYDTMRPVIVNDGWEHTVSDLITLHDYEEFGTKFLERYKDKMAITENRMPFNKERYALAKGYEYHGQPILLSEYGGVAFTTEEGWGYGRQVRDEKEFLERFGGMMQAIRETPYIIGFCYTQLTDVQQEINGLYTMSREPKVNMEEICKINQQLSVETHVITL